MDKRYNRFTFYYLDGIFPKKITTFLNGEVINTKQKAKDWFKVCFSKKLLIFMTINKY